MRLHLNTAWHSFLGIITSHEAGEQGWGLLCAAHVANWLVSCHLVFLQIGKLSFSAGALELLSLLSRLLEMIGFADWLTEMVVYSVFCLIYFVGCLFAVDVRGSECWSIKENVFEQFWNYTKTYTDSENGSLILNDIFSWFYMVPFKGLKPES